MFRYLIAIMVLNSSYRSLGVPIPSTTPVSLADLLSALSTSCENRFLTDQMKNKLAYCSDLSSPHGGKQLECLIFYDINKQLCIAVGASKVALTEDYSTKINEEQDVNILCGTTKDWVFSNIPEFTRYKSSVEKVFKHPVTCGKVCGVEELMSDDSNFFCKYFKWGTDMLKNQVVVPPTQENRVQSPSGTVNVESAPVNSANDLLDVQIKNSTVLNTSNAPLEAASVKTEEVKPETSSLNNQESMIANSIPSEKSELKTEQAEKPLPVEDPVVLEASDQADKPVDLTSPELKNEGQKPESPDTTLTKPDAEDPQKSDVDKEIQLLNKEFELKDPVLEPPAQSKAKVPSDVDDYQDSDEAKDGLGDIQGDDDGDDAMIDDMNKINKLEDPKKEPKEEPKETPDMKAIVSGITGETGLYPSFGQDSYDDDSDDHFFSFFLTAVIMVVLIYVLYHNKNRVGKVFFGLILEGRQTGRRRNSRGHAYKRLDTLEQAMSTKTAAPPSKIIY